MDIGKQYIPQEVEAKWYQYWLEHGFFQSRPNPEKESYTIVIPPPNVTGVLHMGHMLNNTIQDVLIRKARMEGKEACWVPGTDHASIATEAKVVAMLKEKGINKNDISREEFLKHAWVWKEKYGGIILDQLKKLGASCDWNRTRFTMEDSLSRAVIESFVRLYENGHIYRGPRMIHWDPQGKTALADDEVIHREVNGKLYYIRYTIEGDNEKVIIATTRPETLLGDTAICINPQDKRYEHLKGKRAIVPIVNRSVPIIQDEYVNMEFGTGCLKVTPAHDMNDYALGEKHHLKVIDIFTETGHLNESAQHFIGLDRFEAREKIVKELEKNYQLEKIETYTHSIGFSERTNAIVEPRLSTQWFVNIKEMAKPALANVLNDTICFYPPKFKNMYRAWMENVRDWCISRQLWWGQRIPAYYLSNGEMVVANTAEEALEKAKKLADYPITLKDLQQDEDVLDTWFSSWLWPISVFNGFDDPNNEDFNYYYPTSDLVTGPDIIFFWVARMIMAGYEFTGEKPFKNVYFTGTVRDKLGRKMSKSLGNSPDPLELIEKYGADGVRMGMLLSAPAGNDLLFDEKLCEQGRNFSNKLWNAFRLIQSWKTADISPTTVEASALKWFSDKLNESIHQIEEYFQQFRISDALMLSYKLVWNDFCSWYLELIKPSYNTPMAATTYTTTLLYFEKLLKLLHPFIPFITEDLWQSIKKRAPEEALIISTWPSSTPYESDIITSMEHALNLIKQIRNLRAQYQLSPKEILHISIEGSNAPEWLIQTKAIIEKSGHLSFKPVVDKKYIKQRISLTIQQHNFTIDLPQTINKDKEYALLKKELHRAERLLASITQKLNNPNFIQRAPIEVKKLEEKKFTDTKNKIKKIEEQLN